MKVLNWIYNLNKCILLNLTHWYYLFTFQTDILITRGEHWIISPSYVKLMWIGINYTKFTTIVYGNVYEIVVKMDDIVCLDKYLGGNDV